MLSLVRYQRSKMLLLIRAWQIALQICINIGGPERKILTYFGDLMTYIVAPSG